MEKHNDNNNTSKQVLLSVLGVAILIVAVVGISFAAFSYTKAGQEENTISTGTVTMSYNEDTNGISIYNAIPKTDAQGKAQSQANELFDFTVTATILGRTNIDYEVVAVKNNVKSSTQPADWGDGNHVINGATVARDTSDPDDPWDEFVDDKDIRLYLEYKNDGDTDYKEAMAPKAFLADGTNSVTGAAPADSMILHTGNFSTMANADMASNNSSANAVTFTTNYRLRMWVDSAYQIDGFKRKYTVKVNVYGKGNDSTASSATTTNNVTK